MNNELLRNLGFIYSRVETERRDKGGSAALNLLEALKKRYGVPDMPSYSFGKKGYFLYEEAYILRLNNQCTEALEMFEHSALSEEEYSRNQENYTLSLAKAAMSRIAASAYENDINMFYDKSPGQLNPDRKSNKNIINKLNSIIKLLNKLPTNDLNENAFNRFNRYVLNAKFHLCELLAWENKEEEIVSLIGPYDKISDSQRFDDPAFLYGKDLVYGILYLNQQKYNDVIKVLKECLSFRLNKMAGEGTGKICTLMIYSYIKLNDYRNAEKNLLWLLNECPIDAGNGLAIDWGKRIGTIRNK